MCKRWQEALLLLAISAPLNFFVNNFRMQKQRIWVLVHNKISPNQHWCFLYLQEKYFSFFHHLLPSPPDCAFGEEKRHSIVPTCTSRGHSLLFLFFPYQHPRGPMANVERIYLYCGTQSFATASLTSQTLLLVPLVERSFLRWSIREPIARAHLSFSFTQMALCRQKTDSQNEHKCLRRWPSARIAFLPIRFTSSFLNVCLRNRHYDSIGKCPFTETLLAARRLFSSSTTNSIRLQVQFVAIRKLGSLLKLVFIF